MPHRIAILGAGPAGLMAAEVAASAGATVTVFEAMPSPARKFLMAGIGGLNLTHSEEEVRFRERYGAAARWLSAPLDDFGPDALRRWADGLGAETFVGTSGRVFPKAMKASPLLRAWLRRLDGLGVRIETRHRWTGFDGASLRFDTADGIRSVETDATILALGGASWPRLGSDGSWVALLGAEGVAIAPLRPANSGVQIDWSETLRARFAGTPLKNIAIRFGAAIRRGEAVLTRRGLEGGAVYALCAQIREALTAGGTVQIALDLKPDVDAAQLAGRLATTRKRDSRSNRLRKAARLPPLANALLREAGPLPASAEAMAARIKALPLTVTSVEGLERAISSAGGVMREALDPRLMLRALPGTFVAGEMLDWEAPTGGYLLQGCLATGAAAAHGALEWLAETRDS